MTVEAFELSIGLGDSAKSAQDYLKLQEQIALEIRSIRDENKALNKELRNLNKDNSKSDEERIQRQKEINSQLVKNSNNLRQLNKDNRLLAKSFDSVSESTKAFDKLNAELSVLTKRIQDIRAADGVVSQKDLDRFDELSEKITEINQSVNRNQSNVGNYKDAIVEAFEEISDGVDSGITGISILDNALESVTKNPLLGFVALLSTGLSALFQAFKQSERGAKLMEQITSVLSVTWFEFVGLVDSGVESLINFTKDPLQGLKNLGTAIVDNVVNRFEAVFNILGNTGQAIKALVTGDFEKLGSLAQDTARSFIQLGTGLDEAQQNNLSSAFKDLTAEMESNLNAGVKLAQNRRSIRQANINLQKSIESLITEEEKLNQVAGDSTISLAKQLEANEQALEITEKRAKAELALAQNNLQLINAELAIRQKNNVDTLDLQEEQLSALLALEQAERDYVLTLQESATQRRQITQDEGEQRLDILIDGLDNQKTINERLIADDKKSFEERERILNETVVLASKSFAAQIETLQGFTQESINANELLNESDAVTLAERIKALGLSEILSTRLLEVIRERRLATLDLKQAEQELLDLQIKAEQERRASETEIQALPTTGNNQGQNPDIIRDDEFTENFLKNTQRRIDALETEEEKESRKRQGIDATINAAEDAAGAVATVFNEESKAREAALAIQEKITAAEILLSQKRIIQTQLETIANNIKAVSEGAKIPFPANVVAIGTIIASIARAVSAARTLATFHEGIEDAQPNASHRPDNGLKPNEFYAKLEKRERVLSKEQNAELLKLGVKNKEIPELVKAGLQAKNNIPNASYDYSQLLGNPANYAPPPRPMFVIRDGVATRTDGQQLTLDDNTLNRLAEKMAAANEKITIQTNLTETNRKLKRMRNRQKARYNS